jgi:DNA-binding NarL/FixJ family response regulator
MNMQQTSPQRISGEKVRVVLADDHRDVITKIRATLGDEFEIIKVAENGDQAVSAVLALDPDVLVTDISMPVLDGLQAARTIQQANCRAKIVFLTIHEGRDFIGAAFSAGGMCYVTKRCLSTDLAFAIRESMKGNTFVSSSIHS